MTPEKLVYQSQESPVGKFKSAAGFDDDFTPKKRAAQMSPQQRFKHDFDQDSEKVRATAKKSQQIEERGSRSPDKKKRRVFDDEPVGALHINQRVQPLMNGTPQKNSKKLDFDTLRMNQNQASNDSFSGINEDYTIIVQKNMQITGNPSSEERSYSPRIISQNKATKPQINPAANDGMLKHKLSAKTYEQKIIQQKKESYKYRKTKNEEQSIDDKMKTKQLLKNINLDKLLFNRRILMPQPNIVNLKAEAKG